MMIIIAKKCCGIHFSDKGDISDFAVDALKKNALLVFVFLFTFVLAINWIPRKGAIQRDKLLLFPLLHSKLFSRDNCSICD